MRFHHFSIRRLLCAGLFAASLAFAVTSFAPQSARAADAVAAHPEKPGAPITDEAERIYQNYGDAIYQVQVIDKESDKKTVIGSGFQFNGEGLIATNYHVVSEAIAHPESNRLEYLHDTDNKNGSKENRGSLKILIADVVHDLAILKMDKPGKKWVELGTSSLPKGTKLFSLGNPHDIGFTIIEGTYNGLTPDSFFDHIHFSGSLNPGMSGGPALGHDGRVVGINVSTAGNQISFLVPVEPLRQLLLTYIKKGKDYDFVGHADEDIENQLLESQKKNMARIMKEKWESVPFGSFMVPGRMMNAFKCWGGAQNEEKKLSKAYDLTCQTQDQLFLSETFNTGVLFYSYDLLVGKEKLNPLRFYSYYTAQYAAPMRQGYSNGGEVDVTNYECKDSFVDLAGARWKASFCVRQYKKYPKLYDMNLYMALLGGKKQGMMITSIAQGISKENALKLAGRFMNEIKPRKDATPKEPTAEKTVEETEKTLAGENAVNPEKGKPQNSLPQSETGGEDTSANTPPAKDAPVPGDKK